MLIPLGTDRPLRRQTVVTYALIAANVAVFCLQTYFAQTDPDRAQQWASWGKIARQDFHWWQPVTSSFMHGGFWHLFFNMLFLWVFGPNLEDRLGRLWFLIFYLAGGAAAMGLHALVDPHPAIGASGAVSGLTGAYLVMFPRTQVKVFFLLNLAVLWVAAWWFIGIAVVYDLAAGGFGMDRGIAHFAHIGGYLFGAGVAFALLGLKIIPGEPYDLVFQARQALRMREIRAAGRGLDQRVQKQLGTDSSDGAPGPSPAPDPLAEARAAVAKFIAAQSFPAAAAAYKHLANTWGHLPRAAILSRSQHYDLAAWLVQQGDYPSAAYAYDRFLEAYPTDPEAPQIRLLLGRINARHLNDPIRAKVLLNDAITGLHDEANKTLAKQELEALG